MKPKLLVMELWALGDLVLASPFLQAASDMYDVTLLARATARELQPHFWPQVSLIEFSLPWTAFRRKYALHKWPWRGLSGLVRDLRSRHFDLAVSARWDPRDHVLMRLSGAEKRVGFSRLCSRLFLTQSLPRPDLEAHRYEYWRLTAKALGMNLPLERPYRNWASGRRQIVIHSGAGQEMRVWPLERFSAVSRRLRQSGFSVRVLCDKKQVDYWHAQQETAFVPASLAQLVEALKEAALLIGNDSGPGHLAATLGVPTFTIFGNQIAARFAPLNQESQWIEGGECEFKPCYDNCRYGEPRCLLGISADEAWPKIEAFVRKHLISQ